ncbi:riboflavin synthase [Bacillus songklensis]|uniref:Riboflavin synthase n=1 Tax=Bacillus songklensis TaxID=1069116 RepID=A0ABV8B395_9BACI
MFTGIIEEIGRVQHIQKGKDAIEIAITAHSILEDVRLGDSISVNGVCLTVTSFTKSEFTVDVMPETISATTLKTLKRGDAVNLERAMAANGRFGGHFVSGHVDGIGKITRKSPKGNAVYYEIEADSGLLDFMVLKGSVTVDGTSLTIFGLTNETFTISLIPHTSSHTILGGKTAGDIVNIETDMLAKYMRKMMVKEQQTAKRSMTYGLLKEYGFAE